MNEIDWEALTAPFPDEVIKTRPGRGGLTFRYVDARVVAARLDEVLTPPGWDFTWTNEGDHVVHGRLILGGSVKEDAGYPNSDDDEEPLKSAVSDALKRCAVLFGVGRHLYEDNKASRGVPARQAAPPRPRPVPVDDLTPVEDEPNPFDAPASTAPIVRPEQTRCPHHPNREPKEGKYGLFCSGRDCPCANDKGYCQWKGAA